MSAEKNNSNVSHTKHRHLRLGLFGFGCVGQGLYHLCFHPAAAAAPGYRIEATSDFRQWETVHEAGAIDNAVHFVDPDTPDLVRRFYRLSEDPAASGP